MKSVVSHIALPGKVIAKEEAKPRETIARFLIRTEWAEKKDKKFHFRLPTICVVNGVPVPQKDWNKTRIRSGDSVQFFSKPLGGGRGGKGGSILGLIAIIGLSLIAPGIGTAIAGLPGLGFSILGVSSAKLFAAAFVLGGSLLINALVAPKPGGQNQRSPDQIYSAAIAGNEARLFEARSVGYGRLKTLPDFVGTTWSEFEGDDQYLNILLGLGEGKYVKHKMYVDDTEIWDEVTGYNPAFSGISHQFCDPGEDVTLFPVNVSQTVEVSGQQLPEPTGINNDGWIGGFVANAGGTEAQSLAIDLVLPGGCFNTNSDGNLERRNVPIECEYRPVDSGGSPTGPYTTLFSETLSYRTRNPIRRTIKVDVTPGRYEVRLRRTNAPVGGKGFDQVQWAGLRAFIEGPTSFPISVVAVRMKGTAQLSEISSRRLGVLWTRILRVWDADEEEMVEQPTQNPIWAFFDAATDTVYGAKRPESKIDFENIVAHAAAADSRGDTFNYEFKSAMTVPAAFDLILKTARTRHRWAGDILTVVRDSWKGGAGMLLSDREIVRGSLRIEVDLADSEASDSVILEYLDEQTWRIADVQYPPNAHPFFSSNPTRIRLDGVTNRDHGFREAAFYYLQSVYRRKQISLQTEHDGRLLSLGAPVLIQSHLPRRWGNSGAVLKRDGLNLTLAPAPEWEESGQHYLEVRKPNGDRWGPVKVSKGLTDNIAVLDNADLGDVETAQGSLNSAIARQDGAQEPSFVIGVAGNLSVPGIVVSGSPKEDTVELVIALDDERVHATDLGSVPALPALPALIDSRAPTISYLVANFRQGNLEPMLDVAWWPSSGATRYIAEVSYDDGDSWTPVYDGTSTKFSAVVDYADLTVRVAAVGVRVGPWSAISVTAPEISLAPGMVDPDSIAAGLRDWILKQLKDRTDALFEAQQTLAAVVARQDSDNALQRLAAQTQLTRVLGQARATASSLISVAVGDDSAIAQQLTELQAAIGQVEATLTARWIAAVTPEGALAAYELQLTAEDTTVGIQAIALGGGEGYIRIDADKFYVGKEGIAGYTPIFIVDTGSPGAVIFNADLIANGTITAEKLNVITLSALSADLGVIQFGIIRDAGQYFEINANERRILISDDS